MSILSPVGSQPTASLWGPSWSEARLRSEMNLAIPDGRGNGESYAMGSTARGKGWADFPVKDLALPAPRVRTGGLRTRGLR